MINGIGTDIVEIQKIDRLYRKWGNRLIQKIFNFEELPKYKIKRRFIESLAGKFAAKEAISKAFGTGIGKSLSFKDIKIIKNHNGKPEAYIKSLEKNDVIHISISHTDEFATSFAIWEKK